MLSFHDAIIGEITSLQGVDSFTGYFGGIAGRGLGGCSSDHEKNSLQHLWREIATLPRRLGLLTGLPGNRTCASGHRRRQEMRIREYCPASIESRARRCDSAVPENRGIASRAVGFGHCAGLPFRLAALPALRHERALQRTSAPSPRSPIPQGLSTKVRASRSERNSSARKEKYSPRCANLHGSAENIADMSPRYVCTRLMLAAHCCAEAPTAATVSLPSPKRQSRRRCATTSSS